MGAVVDIELQSASTSNTVVQRLTERDTVEEKEGLKGFVYSRNSTCILSWNSEAVELKSNGSEVFKTKLQVEELHAPFLIENEASCSAFFFASVGGRL